MVEKTFTTEFSTAGEGVSADPLEGAGLADEEGGGDVIDGSSGETGEPAGAGAASAALTAKKQKTDKTAPRARDRIRTTKETFIRQTNITAPPKARPISIPKPTVSFQLSTFFSPLHFSVVRANIFCARSRVPLVSRCS